MKLQLVSVAAAVPLCSALATPRRLIQDILLSSENNDAPKNPLDEALDSNPLYTPFDSAHEEDDDIDTGIKDFFNHPIDSVDNIPVHIPTDSASADTDSIFPPLFPPRRDKHHHHHHHHHHDKTIYQLINESKHTTILAKIINEDSKLVDYLNSTKTNFTFFAPTDHAFRRLRRHLRHHHRHHHKGSNENDADDDDDHHHHHLPKEFIRALARYHSSPEVLCAAQLLHSHTIPSALEDPLLGHKKGAKDASLPQRISVRTGLKGLVLNIYSRIVAADIHASNGIIHGLSNILLPPPPATILLEIVPSHFSTFTLALYKTHLIHTLNTSISTHSHSHAHGTTLFIPTNTAFARLGLHTNAFLFSPPGTKYLRALLKYHVVPNRTLYSDVLYTQEGEIKPFGRWGFTHLDLPTLLECEREDEAARLAVDIARFGPYASFRVNGFYRVAFADALAKDGNLHVLERVLVPPRRVGGVVHYGEEEDDGGEIAVEELKERLRPWVDGDAGTEIDSDRDDGVEIDVYAADL